MSAEVARMGTHVRSLLEEVAAEVDQWSECQYPFASSEADQQKATRAAESWRVINRARAQLDAVSWDGIVSAKAFDALGETDPAGRRQKLIELAAVALAAASE